MQVSPLQMAIAYAAIANGGKIVQPHLGLEIESPAGELVQRIEREPARKVDDRPGPPRRRARGPAPRGERARRHVGRRLRRLEPRRASRSSARPARRERKPKARPVLVRRLRARPQAPDRRRGDRRGGRLRRRRRRADRLPDARRVLRPGREPVPGRERRRRDERARRHARRPRACACRSTRCWRSPRSGSWSSSIVSLDATTGAPGDAARRRRSARAIFFAIGIGHGDRPQPRRLLAPARAEVRRLRPDDGRHPARRGLRRRHARLAPRDPAAVLRGPGVRARQGPADRRAGGVRRRPRPRPRRARHDGAARARRDGAGDPRDVVGPRLGPRLHRDPVRRAVRRRRRAGGTSPASIALGAVSIMLVLLAAPARRRDRADSRTRPSA